MFRKFSEHLIGICLGQVYLVHRYDNGNTGIFGVVNSLNGLGHYSVVGGYYQYRYIGYLSSSGPQSGKSFVARCIEECYFFPTFQLNLGSTDMLGYTPFFSTGYIGFSNTVEQGSFTVINVTHYDNHRGSLLKFTFLFLELFLDQLLNFLFWTFYFGQITEFFRYLDSNIGIYSVVDSGENSPFHQFGYDFVGGYIQKFRQFSNGNNFGNLDNFEFFLLLLFLGGSTGRFFRSFFLNFFFHPRFLSEFFFTFPSRGFFSFFFPLLGFFILHLLFVFLLLLLRY